MSDNIVKRLRELIIADAVERREIVNGILAERLIRERHKAADEIERLEAERDALREALEPFAKWCDEMEIECPTLRDDARVASDITMADVRRARVVYEKIKG